jgi:hypothetical protein
MNQVKHLRALRWTTAIMGCLFACATAQAINITALNTGAGLFSVNNGAVLVDPNWTVSLLSTVPAGQTPPGGIPTGAAYLIPNNLVANVDPFSTHWLPNSAASSWLTYSSPTSIAVDNTGDTFRYEVKFTAASSGAIGVNFLSDNTDTLYINGVPLGSNPAQYGAWLTTPIPFSVTAGTTYTVDLDIHNTVEGDLENPTGARVEFSGNVDVGTSVPDTGSTFILLLFGLSSFVLIGNSRKNQSVIARNK